MVFTASKIQAVGMLLISAAINLAFLYGIVGKPVISYHLSTPLAYNATLDLDIEGLSVEFNVRNKGFSPARVLLIVRLYNMSPPITETFSVEEADGTFTLRASMDLPAHQLEYDALEVKFDSAANATYLALIFHVGSDWKAELPTRFHNSFAVYKPERPTALLLKHLGEKKFLRVRRK